jgi:hypothetical protein
VVDRRGQLVEEPPEPFEVSGIEGGDAGPELEPGAVQAMGSRAVRITSAPSVRARLAVSSPMPELPPITTTVCPASSGLPLMMSPPRWLAFGWRLQQSAAPYRAGWSQSSSWFPSPWWFLCEWPQP